MAQTEPVVVFIGIGSNLGDRMTYLRNAVDAISQLGDSVSLSSVYESEPFGVADQCQPPYLNMVMSIRTVLDPMQLLLKLLDIERSNGRVRHHRNESRTLDLDVLLIGDEVIKSDELIVPHPRMHQRSFVMIPIVEIAPDLVPPTFSKSMERIAHDLTNQGVKRLGSLESLATEASITIPASEPV